MRFMEAVSLSLAVLTMHRYVPGSNVDIKHESITYRCFIPRFETVIVLHNASLNDRPSLWPVVSNPSFSPYSLSTS